MGRKTKVKNPEHMGPKEVIGLTALSTTSGISSIFMSTMFMNYMTDYAGLGAWGASLATVLLLVARIFDAVDDPLQSFIMDSAKPHKNGKYKPFFMASILLTTLGTVLLYGLPRGIATKPALVSVWVILFYLVYDLGTSFFNINLMARTMTNDPNERAKLVIGPRLWVMVLGMVGSAMMSIIVAVNSYFNNYNTTFTVVCGTVMLVCAVISIIGWCMVKENHVVEPDPEDKVKISDLFKLFKINKAMDVRFLQNVFYGFIWTLLFATPTYYVKWGLCADLTTGKVDMKALGLYSLLVSMMMLVPLLLGSLIAQPIMKKAFKGNPIRFIRFNLLVIAAGGAFLFVMQITGILQHAPAAFFVGMFIMALGIGVDFVPSSAVDMEVMDYTIYKTGKDRSALTGVANNLLSKAQTALSSALVGAILVAIGYNVNSKTGDYAGDVSALPGMLNWFIFIMGLVPAILGLISFFILGKYPIDDATRADMQKVLHNTETDAATAAEEAGTEK